MKVAIVGSGVSGLSAAHALHGQAQVSLIEAADYFGGHTHTVDVTLPSAGQPVTHGVDTGFLVFNERTYPGLIALLAELGVPSAASDMSFSVQVPRPDGTPGLEWNGATLNTVFAQRSNLLRPRFWAMLREVLRFNTLASSLAESGQDAQLQQPLADFLNAHGFGDVFRDWYLLPMLGCIWSCPTDQMLRFPVATLIRFCHNHGLIQVNNRPRWHTVRGGARQYVARITERIGDKRLRTPVRRIERSPQGVRVFTDAGPETFDQVILACHADQALAMLAQPSLEEATTLAAIRSQPNEAVLHTDASVMPQRQLAWAAWNYERSASAEREQQQVCLHYWINHLQPLPFDQPVIVSLNPLREIDPAQVLGRYAYDHPVFDLAAIEAQRHMAALQGQQRTWYAGAWLGYGFHEDGLRAGQAAARGILNGAAPGPHGLGA
jgi:predicted NAD/FAD-binding protein